MIRTRALAAAMLVALATACSSRSINRLSEVYVSYLTRFPVMMFGEFSELVDGALAYRNFCGRWPDDAGELRRALMRPDRPGLRYRYLSFEDCGRGRFEAVFHAYHSPKDARCDSLEYHGLARLTVPFPADGPIAGCDLEISIFETVMQDSDDIQIDKNPVTIRLQDYVPGRKSGDGKAVASGEMTIFDMRLK
jgi:hypothetical protein